MAKKQYLERYNPKSETWSYRFKIEGKVYRGNTGMKDESAAHNEAVRLRGEAVKSNSVLEVLAQRKEHLIGDTKVAIEDAWDKFDEVYLKTSSMDKADKNAWRGYFNGFARWMKTNYPAIEMMHDVTDEHAKGYWHYAKSHRVDKPSLRPSTTTANNYRRCLEIVFAELSKIATIPISPFRKDVITPLKNIYVEREAFRPAEMKLIRDNAEGWLRYVYMVGVHTGLREGNICLLKWENVDLPGNRLRSVLLLKTQNITGKVVNIPLMPALREYLETLPREEGQVFVNPHMAAWYKSKSRCNIGKKFGAFLRSLGLKTHRKIEGRRDATVRDVHSLRHTFVYIAGMHGIPISLVQDICGHGGQQQTDRYNSHSNEEDKQKYFESLDFHVIPERADSNSVSTEALAQQIAEKQMHMARAEAAQAKLALVVNMLEMMTAENFEQVKGIISQTASVMPSEATITVEPIQQAQIAN